VSEKSLRLLLIEDDVVDCEVVRRLLRGFAILSEVSTGIQGVEAAASTRPDCVLLSTRLPHTDPIEALDRIVAERHQVPVVLLAEAGDEEIVALGIGAGALGWVPKGSLTAQNLRLSIQLALRTSMARREVKEARRELDYIAGNLAQEFGVPLRRIADLGETLHARLAGQLDDAAATDLAHVREYALGMASLVDDLAEYSSAARGEAESTWVDLNDAIRLALDQLVAPVRSSGAQIEVEPLPTVWGDAGALTRLLKNLLLNSMRTHGRGTPFIRVSSHLQEGDWEVWIQDNGPGIDPGMHSRIFRPTLPEPGVPQERGLSLATCARIVERHGGRIRLLSKPGHGSIFRFTLKVPPVESPAGPR
jgi:light-regulated signal transduction histidine kinase (bacteriophytochrome)